MGLGAEATDSPVRDHGAQDGGRNFSAQAERAFCHRPVALLRRDPAGPAGPGPGYSGSGLSAAVTPGTAYCQSGVGTSGVQ